MPVISLADFKARKYRTKTITIEQLGGDIVVRKPDAYDMSLILPIAGSGEREAADVMRMLGVKHKDEIYAVLARNILEPELTPEDFEGCDADVLMALFAALVETIGPSEPAVEAKAAEEAGEAKN